MQGKEDVPMPTSCFRRARMGREHRVTASPRFRAERGALWLGLGLCFATLFVLRATDPR
ncbi:hypothetical protein GCM10028794_06650 [Silanimonas algicola]